MTSAKPSPLTSPAEATEMPKFALVWSLSPLQCAVVASPEAEPW